MHIASPPLTFVDAIWASGNKTARNVVLAVLGSVALWVSAKIQVPFYPVPMTMQTFVVLAVFVSFRYLLQSNRYEAELLFSAIFGHLLLALTWAFVYANIERWWPGSFTHSLEVLDWSTFQYFSLLTLTTLGFGEITPANALTRNLVAFEAVMGVMYVAVLIGSIIGNYKAERNESDRD